MEIIHDKDELLAYFQEDVFLHIYSIGDLSDFFWKQTIWYGLREGGRLTAVILFYVGVSTPTLLALTNNRLAMKQLLKRVMPILPSQFYAHITPGLEDDFAKDFDIDSHGLHLKMGLRNQDVLNQLDISQTVLLTPQDVDEVQTLYDESYPENWFEPHMLEIGHYYGIRESGKLVSVAGVHVYSEAYKVAALGGITTHPHYRGKRYAQRTIARLCRELSKTVDHIGLNVLGRNDTAVKVYQKLGFDKSNEYIEVMLTRK